MYINLQIPQISALLHEMLNAIPEERQAEFAMRVDRLASEICHPNVVDGAYLFEIQGMESQA